MSEALVEEAPEAIDESTVEAVETPVVEETVVEPQGDPRVAELEAALEHQQAQFGQLVEYLQSQGATRAQAEAGATDQIGFDPSDLVDEFGQLVPQALVQLFSSQQQALTQAIDQRFQAIAAPLAAREEAESVAEGEARLNDILVDDIARNGEFSSDPETDKQARTLVRTLADQAFPEVAQRYGMTPRAAEIAMNRTADQVRGLLKAHGAAAVTAHVNHNATLASQRNEPGAGSGAGLVTTTDEILPEGALSRRYAADARRLSTP